MKSINCTYIILVLSLTLFISCDFFLVPRFTEISRTYSPDSTKFLLEYFYKVASWDTLSPGEIIILDASAKVKPENINYFYSRYFVDNIYWKGNDTVVIEENYASFISHGKSDLKDTILNDVFVKIVQRDPIDTSFTRKISFRETSPDNTHELIVYKYVKSVPGNYFLNVSVINKGDSIPKFGNFYISLHNYNFFTDVRWDSTSVLDIKTLYRRGYELPDCLVKNRPDIKYKVDVNEYPGNIENPGVIMDYKP